MKKKILVLSSRVPYPLIGGDRIRIYNFGKILRQEYAVDLAFTNDLGKDYSSELSKVFDNLFEFPFNSKLLVLNSLRGIFSRKPIQVMGNYFNSMQKWFNRIKDKYDLIICNHIRMAEYLLRADAFQTTKLIDYHDALSLHYRDSAPCIKGFWRLFYAVERKRLENYEYTVAGRFKLGLITSKIDKEYFRQQLGLSLPLFVVPMGVENDLLSYNVEQEEHDWITFLGKMSTHANELAVEFFAEKVFPSLRRSYPNLEFMIIGNKPTLRVRRLERIAGVRVLGFVADPYSLIRQGKILVSPQLIGAGIQNKVLQAMALGKPVVGTERALRAIDGENGKHFIKANTPEKMIATILELLENKGRRVMIGRNARELIIQQYTWDKIGRRLLSIIEECLNSRHDNKMQDIS